MKDILRSVLPALFVFAISRSAFASKKNIGILEVDNQSDLTDGDVQAIYNPVIAVFKMLPNDQYTVGKIALAPSSTTSALCDEACLIGKAGQTGVDFAVHIAVSSLTGGHMAILNLFDAKTGQLISSKGFPENRS